jgi:hypothetical protein
VTNTESSGADGIPQRRPWPRRPGQGARSSLTPLWSNPNVRAVGFGLVCTVVSWPVISLAPTIGLDPSWRFALAASAVHHIAWGPRLDFTYGPLGFLTVRALYFGSTAALAFAYQFVVELALFSLLFRFTRKTLPIPLAALVTYAIGATAVALVDSSDLLMAPTLLLGILAVRQNQQWHRRVLIAVISTVSAVGFFIKFTDGLVALGIVVVVAAVGQGSKRVMDGALAMTTFVVVLVASWLATGNALGDLFSYFRYSIAVAGGYSSAMQIETGRTDEWWYAGIVLVLVAALAGFRVRSADRREQVGTALILIGYAWWAMKEGFVRHDGHDLIFFGLMFVTLVVFDTPLPRLRPFYIATVTFVGVITWSAAGSVPANLVTFASDTHSFGQQVHILVSGRLRNATINTAREQMQQNYDLGPDMLSALNGRSVAIEPWENSVAWAYPSLRWDPEPVVQAYSAYTPSLDALDSRFLESSAAPSRILQQPLEAIDGRDPFFEPPTTYVTTVCRYRQLDASSTWQVLMRVPDRCGPARFISRVTATFGVSVEVPVGPPDEMVVARIRSLPLTIGYKISSLILKPPIVLLNSAGITYRFVTATAGDLHLLRPASSIGYTAPFMPSTVASFTLTGAGMAPGTGHYSVSFFGIRVAAP